MNHINISNENSSFKFDEISLNQSSMVLAKQYAPPSGRRSIEQLVKDFIQRDSFA